MAIFVLGGASVAAEIAPTLSTKTLTDSANVIVVGRVERVQETGIGDVTFDGANYTRHDYAAEIIVDETIKGEPVPQRFIINFSTPSADGWGNVAEGGLQSGTYRVVFLNKTSSGYKFASAYYPSIPASPKSCGPSWQVKLGEDAYGRVLERLLDLLCTDSTSEEKQSVFFVLNWWEDSPAAPFLKAALNLPSVTPNPNLRIPIVSDLLHWKDLSVLPLADEDLFDQSLQSSVFPKWNLVLAVSTLEPQISIPLLARVLKLADPDMRLAAARFLEDTHSQAALPVLLSALDDPNRQVQFAVMQSLGNLTSQHQWRPNTIDTDSHWEACIKHWHDFEKETKRVAP